MHISFKPLHALDPVSVWQMLKLRQDVFCIEQRCLYPDIDDQDTTAIHVLALQEKALLGYARIYEQPIGKWHIGRIIIQSPQRGLNLGQSLVKACVEHILNVPKVQAIELSAQLHLSTFYSKLGFKELGSSYFEDGIPHIKMVLENGM